MSIKNGHRANLLSQRLGFNSTARRWQYSIIAEWRKITHMLPESSINLTSATSIKMSTRGQAGVTSRQPQPIYFTVHQAPQETILALRAARKRDRKEVCAAWDKQSLRIPSLLYPHLTPSSPRTTQKSNLLNVSHSVRPHGTTQNSHKT